MPTNYHSETIAVYLNTAQSQSGSKAEKILQSLLTTAKVHNWFHITLLLSVRYSAWELTQHRYSVLMGGVYPAGWWYGYHMMTEVDKSVHQVPVVESVGIILS